MNTLQKSIIEIMQNNDYEVLIDNVGIFQFPSSYRFDCHEHNKVEINYINNGYCIMGIEDKYIHLKENECIIIYPNVPHFFIVDDRRSCRITQLEFNINGLNSDTKIDEELVFLKNLTSKSRKFEKLYNCDEIKSSIEKIKKGKNKISMVGETLLNLYFFEIYLKLSDCIKKAMEQNSNFKNDKINNILKYINENIRNPLDIEEICTNHNISSRYLRKMFGKTMEMNITEYITLLRINGAKEMIEDFSFSITEIAFNMGFSSSQYFSKVFKKSTGMTPMEYRNVSLNKKIKIL